MAEHGGHGRQQVFDKEKVHWNTAWLKRGGEHVEIVINPDEGLEFQRTAGKQPDIRECLRSTHVFSDAKRGEICEEGTLVRALGTKDELEAARKILLEGEIQLSAEHRAQLREARRNAIVAKLHAYAIDPKTGLAHPRARLELAMEEAKVRIDERKDPDEQVAQIVRALQPIIPIRLETVTMQVHLPSPYGQKLYGELERVGSLRKAEWLPDGGLLAWVEIPAGLQGELIDGLGSKTHGGAEVKKINDTPMKH